MTADPKLVDQEAIERFSLELEEETGYDSIPTIERHYDGRCVFPGCAFRTRDTVKMWQHAHFGRKHGQSFGYSLAALIEQRFLTEGE